MKNTILTLLVIFALLQTAYGQVAKGSVLIGSTVGLGGGVNALLINPTNSGGLNFVTSKNKSDNSNQDEDKETGFTISLSPNIGYFLTDGLAGGISLNILYQSSKPEGADESATQTILLAGPFLRYYFTDKKVKPYLEVNPAFGSSKSKFGSFENKTSLTKLSGGAGVAIFLGEKVSFDALLHYERFTTKDKEDNPDNERQILGTFGVNVGFSIFL